MSSHSNYYPEDVDTRGTSLTINVAVYHIGEIITLLEDAGFVVEINVGARIKPPRPPVDTKGPLPATFCNDCGHEWSYHDEDGCTMPQRFGATACPCPRRPAKPERVDEPPREG